jgi:hypothetical protein
MANNKKWVQNMDLKKGALTTKAKKAGGIKKGGGIKESFLTKAEKSPNPTTRKQAVLAETFKKMKGGKK